ncbi:MAG: hypothetical protein AB7H77_09420, partial [Bdellovibrionales bacterium]
ILVELGALMEAVSELSHTLVIGTTSRLVPGGEIDNMFGITLTLPGAPIAPIPPMPLVPEVHRMLAGVAEYYLNRALQEGYTLIDFSRDAFIARLLVSVTNAAQIEDIVVLCQTAAIYSHRKGLTKDHQITADMLETAIRRVVTTDDIKRAA